MKNKIRRTWIRFRNRVLLTKDEVKLMQIGALTALELNKSTKFRTLIKGTTYDGKLRKIIKF
jgi:hypothetical protein